MSNVSWVLRWYGHGFGFGKMPIFPGTFGTLPALLIAMLIKPYGYPILFYMGLLILAYVSADQLGRSLGDSDHPSIVCDEIIGIMPALLITPADNWLHAFVYFRLFDIIKPWPISWVNNHVKGAFGCLLDDVLAGVLTVLLLYLFY